MNKKQLSISIVIPVYNEEKRIPIFLEKILIYLTNKNFSYEFVIIDDGSTDKTVVTIKQILDAKVPGTFKVVQLPVNSGKGAAIRKGMLEANGEHIFFLDADGSTAIEEIDRFIPSFTEDIDIYIAQRTLKQKAPFKRKFFGYGYILFANLLLQLDVKDITCGFKCFKKRCVQTIFARQTLNNWSFDAENIFIARKHGYKIKEIQVAWKHTPGSKVKVFKNVLVCGIDLVKIRLNDLRGLYT